MFFTRRQLEILDFIRAFLRANRVAPTLEEMARHFGVSKITIHEHVQALEQKGVLRRAKNRARSIELIEAEPADATTTPLSLPVLGLVRAGAPTAPFEVPEVFDVAGWLGRPDDFHLLRVTGESMIDEQIREGDLILIDRRRTARQGDLVVAATPDGDVTLKRIYRDGDRIRLQPANAAMEPIYVEHVDVRGVVVGLIRQL